MQFLEVSYSHERPFRYFLVDHDQISIGVLHEEFPLQPFTVAPVPPTFAEIDIERNFGGNDGRIGGINV